MYSQPSFLAFVLGMPYFIMKEAFEEGTFFLGFLATFSGICYVMAALIAIYGLFYLADSAFIPTREALGKVKRLTHTPERTRRTLVMIGKVPTYRRTATPPSWMAEVDVDREPLECIISEEQYARLRLGQMVRVIVGNGRFSNGTYCKEILA